MTKESTKLKIQRDGWIRATLHCWIYLVFGSSYQQINPGQDPNPLNQYELTTKQLPPQRIKLLKNDIIALYLFDYAASPPLLSNMTARFDYDFSAEEPFFTFFENKNQPNLSHILIYANKIKAKNKTRRLNFTVSESFSLENKTKNASKSYSTVIQVIYKYKASSANFENFDENLVFRMRSNETNLTFPMNSDDIYGNNFNLSIKQTNLDAPKVGIQISQRFKIQNQSFYHKKEKSVLFKNLGLSKTAEITIWQRMDKPWLYRVDFVTYEMSGALNFIEKMTFNYLDFREKLKINTYTHIVTLNANKTVSYMLIVLLKMSPKDPLPLSRLFYPDYKLVYYQIGSLMYDASFSWVNVKKIWVFKLEKSIQLGQSQVQVKREQKVVIFEVFLPDQTRRFIGEFNLKGLKSELDAKFNLTRAYTDIVCIKIDMFSISQGVLGCRLVLSESFENGFSEKSLEVYVSISLERDKTGQFSVEAHDIVTSINPQGKHLEALCVINYWRTETGQPSEINFIKPFMLVYHEVGKGYYMKAQTKEWIELIQDAEIEQGLDLQSTICQANSASMVLQFQKELKTKRRINQELVNRTWSRTSTYVLNLDSRFRGDSRVVAIIENEVPFSKNSTQRFFETFDKNKKLLLIGNSGRLSNIRRMYFRTTIDLAYPKIILSTNSTKNFTAHLKMYIDQNSSGSQGAYGFPLQIRAETSQKFKLEPAKQNQLSALKNREYNLEEYFEITGPMNSIQQVTTPGGRLGFKSRCLWAPTIMDTNPEYLFVRWGWGSSFFGVTKNSFSIFDFINNSTSDAFYTQEILSISKSCCSSTLSFYALHYNPKLVNSLSVRLLDIIRNYKDTNKTLLKSYQLKYIDSMMIPPIKVATSKQFIKSIGDGVLALCLHDKA